jgi:hypothetical protein
MEKWKKAFDEFTQIPKARPLPSALFVNHVTDLDGIVESGISVTPDLEAKCKEVKDRTEAIAVYHVNSVSNDNIYEAFEDFSWKIFEDI